MWSMEEGGGGGEGGTNFGRYVHLGTAKQWEVLVVETLMERN